MPLKLIGSLIVAAIAALFTGYNLGNKCDVWIFHTFKDVPVAFTIIVSLIAGVVITLPFTFGKNAPRKPTEKDMALLRKAQRKEALQKMREEKLAAKEARRAEKEKAKKEAEAKKEQDAKKDSEPLSTVPAQPTTVEYRDSSLESSSSSD